MLFGCFVMSVSQRDPSMVAPSVGAFANISTSFFSVLAFSIFPHLYLLFPYLHFPPLHSRAWFFRTCIFIRPAPFTWRPGHQTQRSVKPGYHIRTMFQISDTNHRPSVLWHCWLGHLTRKIVSEMTYNVSSGTLNPTIPYIRLFSHSNSRPWEILRLYSNFHSFPKSNPDPSIHIPTETRRVSKTLIVVHGKEWFSLEWAHKLIHYYSTLVSHSTH